MTLRINCEKGYLKREAFGHEKKLNKTTSRPLRGHLKSIKLESVNQHSAFEISDQTIPKSTF